MAKETFEHSELIALRPHHIVRFLDFYFYGNAVNETWVLNRYGKLFLRRINNLWKELAFERNRIKLIMVVESIDTICRNCSKARIASCEEPDDLSPRFPGAAIMELLEINVGRTYDSGDFFERIHKAYPSHSPIKEDENSEY